MRKQSLSKASGALSPNPNRSSFVAAGEADNDHFAEQRYKTDVFGVGL
jgi:hypothetical protein